MFFSIPINRKARRSTNREQSEEPGQETRALIGLGRKAIQAEFQSTDGGSTLGGGGASAGTAIPP